MTSPLVALPTWILSSAAGRAHQTLHKGLAEAGVTGYEYRCLAALVEAEPLSQTDLAASAALDPGDVTHTVRVLEQRRLVSRAKDPRHGRRMLVSLTASGRDAARRANTVMKDIQVEVFGRLTPEERSTLLRLLELVG